MKKVYWRPRAVSRTALLLISVVSVCGLLFVQADYNRSRITQPHYKIKKNAVELADRCMRAIKQERRNRKIYIDPEIDRADSGLIGISMSYATSVPGVLTAKRTTINPNFAAVIVDMLMRAGVGKDDYVAVGCSGSFPALNICVYAALETLKCKPVIISSAAASQWGANIEDFLWLDMEKVLYDAKLISFRSSAASLGGVEDRGLGMSDQTLKVLQEGIRRSGLPEMESARNYRESFSDSVDKRMRTYKDGVEGGTVQCYINVGGGTTSVGTSLGKKLMHSGLNFTLPHKARDIDSVMTRFLKEGVPVIHLVRITELAHRYGLKIAPDSILNEPSGEVFFRHQYNTWYTSGVLAVILLSLYAFIRSDWGFRIFQTPGRRSDSGHPEPMI